MPTAPSRVRLLAIASGAAVALGGVARGAERHWRNPAGGMYQMPSNWLEFTFPGATDIAVFDIPGSYTVTLNLGTVNAGVSVVDGFPTINIATGTFDVNGPMIVGNSAAVARLGLTNGATTPSSVQIGAFAGGTGRLDLIAPTTFGVTNALIVGQLGAGQLVASPASITCADAIFAQLTGSSADVHLDGSASLSAGNTIVVGGAGQAMATLTGGALLSVTTSAQPIPLTVAASNGSVGVIAASDANTRVQTGQGELVVGNAGNGTLNLAAGAVASSGQGSVGVLAGSTTSAVNIMGSGSRWDMAAALQVGLNGKGAMNLTASGDAASSGAGFIGVFGTGDGEANVAGTGSTLILGGQLQVGSGGKGRMTISAGGSVTNTAVGSPSNTAAIVGLQGLGDGGVTVTGASAIWTNTAGSLVVGWGAIGALDILSAGLVNSNAGYIGRNPGSLGAVRITGANSRWAVSGPLRVGIDPAGATGGASSLTVSSGGVMQATSVIIGPPGTLLGDSTVASATVENRGVIAPGLTNPGTLTIQGAFTQTAAGKLSVNIDGTGTDKLSVTGAATISGATAVTVPNGFSPPAGTSFTVLTAASRTGTFTSLTSTPMPGGRSFQPVYTAGAVALMVVIGPGCPGDTNADGRVDFIDLNAVLSAFGQAGASLPGDVNHDGHVDFLDLNIVLSAYGTIC